MKNNIKLTSDEKELFDILRNVVKKVSPGTTLRVAGGWVRDKLSGKESNDIDFMIDNMPGEKIARLITKELGLTGPHVVEANPNASKHLETAGVKIPISSGKEFDLDFAMARQEIYHDNSRIPDTKPATPQEDAFRRDLTINSMFYNIMNGELEDFTGKGLEDLKNNIIRTPEDPLKTFKDDPLRIFRTIRFAARYNGQIDPETLSAMNDPKLHKEIQNKVSKERIEEELHKTLKGPNPILAINLLKNSGILYEIITEAVKGSEFEGKLAPLDMEQNNPHHELTVWGHTVKVIENILMHYPNTKPERRVVMILTALMHDMGKLYYEIQEEKGDKTSYSGHDKASSEISKLILRYLKFSSDIINEVSELTKHHMKIHQVETDPNLINEISRGKYLRRQIRKMISKNIDAMDIMNLSMADVYSKGNSMVKPEVVRKYQLIKEQLKQAMDQVNQNTIDKRFMPILNGREIMSILNIGQGKMIGDASRFIMELMDENPNLTKDEAAEKLREEFIPKLDDDERIRQASACPKHLLLNKVEKILESIEEKNGDKAVSLMINLKEFGSDDESVYEHIASCMFKTLLFDKTKRNLDLLTYIFKKSEENFFDVDLCMPVLGILLLINTGTEDKVIEKICNRMNNMAHVEFQSMIEELPEDAYNKKLIKRFKNGRCKCK